MAEKILIMGESGTGKSTSIRNCNPETTAIINPVGKPLPFRGSKKFTTLNGETDSNKICEFMKGAAKYGVKVIIVDDFQYILAIPFMNRIKETGWDKYNDFGENYFKIIDVCKELPDDVCVYYMTHCETLDNGITTVKLIGKLLREKITIEGLFTIVLRTCVSEGKYYFFTQNNGKDTVKSPLGMFDAFSIENDLNYVDAKIRNYYEFDGAASDAEIQAMDQDKAGEVKKPEPRRRRGGAKTNDGFVNIPEGLADELPIVDSETSESIRHRKTHDEVVAENNQKIEDYMEAVDKVVEEAAGNAEEVSFDEINLPEPEKLDPVPRRKLLEAQKADDQVDIDKTMVEAGEETPKRRTRRARG